MSVIKGAKIRPGSRDEFHNKKLYVPPLPPTNVRNCHLIHLNYDVFVSRTHNYIVKTLGRTLIDKYKNKYEKWGLLLKLLIRVVFKCDIIMIIIFL